MADNTLVDHTRRNEVRRRVLGIVCVRARSRGEVDELQAKLGGPGDDVAVEVLVRREEIARRVYSELTQQQPNDAGAWTMLGASLDGLNREEDAIAAYNKAISLNPKNSETYRELGLAQAKLKHFQDAVASLQKAAELDPNNGEIQKDLADVYTVMGNTTAAAAAKRRAEELSRSNSNQPTAKQP